jgi:hypothetical protein
VKYIDTSLADTIHLLLTRDEEKKAMKLFKDFKLSVSDCVYEQSNQKREPLQGHQ